MTQKVRGALGVDIGGTKIAVGIVDRTGTILRQERTPMIANSTPEAALSAVVSAIDSMFSTEAEIESIGICAPGPLDPKKGIVLNPPNLPCWRNFPLAEKISARYNVPVKVDNDANAAALAETLWGVARKFHYVFYATVGTGIGTGFVFDGAIYHGNTGSAAEGGHVSIDYHGPVCKCGKRGCIEILASGTAIGLSARTKVAADPARGCVMLEMVKGDINAITSHQVGEGFASGDPLAREILEETVHHISIWLGNIIDLLDPDVMVIGGGVAAMLRPFFQEIQRKIPEWCVNPRAAEIPLLMAHYGPDAGIAGGAALCC
jgi:glucokinase